MAEDFDDFATGRWDRLVRAAVLLGASLPEAEDLAQETLLRCYLHWSKVQRADNQEAYVARMLLNCQRQSHRRRWWGERPSDALPDAAGPDFSDAADTADVARTALVGLRTPARQVVVLRIYLGLGVDETAEVLGVAPGTVKSRLSRALDELSASPALAGLRTEEP